MIDLNHLRVFERVAAHGSFSAAARELGLPRSSVSRAISALEDTLGARLMQRTTRAVRLTAAGAALHERAAVIMDDLETAVHVIEDLNATPSGPLRISAGVPLGTHLLGDALPVFLERYPDIRVDLRLENAPVNLLAENIDVAVRIGDLPDSSFVAQRIGILDRVLCAAPSYLDAFGRPERPEDLAGHRIVDLPPEEGRFRIWELAGKEGSATVRVEPTVTVDNVLTLHRIVRGGAGIAITAGKLFHEDEAEGVLERILPDYEISSVPLSLIYPSRKGLSPAVRAFADFMRELGASKPVRC
ncbi:LysR family transcriptional regulator [Halodurantibacterium flavum]|uniref:LysR substrate-binding domain-containing protein n=1 Tax=Halodurantibacterium flavum TaxID=1382802 RepID=A0ABW4S2P8_9RHOB